jgi:predicted nucleic acid-binding protein
MDGSVFQLITTDLVFVETLKHIQRMAWDNCLPEEKVEQFVDFVLQSGEVTIIQTNSSVWERGYQISKNFKDQKVDFIDGVSLAIIEQMGILYAFSFDSHFSYSYKKGYNFIFVQRFPD